jgi:hypothetical protein
LNRKDTSAANGGQRKKPMKMTYKDFTNYVKLYPDENGRFGEYGGAFLLSLIHISEPTRPY